ncbi:MAG TPA: hypothetical protein V6C76_14185 [Drouetiella sp.]
MCNRTTIKFGFIEVTPRSYRMMTVFVWLMFALVLFSLLLNPAKAASNAESFQSLGTFSNVVRTVGGEDEHATGYTVSLWKTDGKMIGVFTSQYGLADMKPCGILDHIDFDPKAGMLKFDSKLTTGTTTHQGKEVATRELYKFSGKLKASVLSGKLTNVDMLEPHHSPQTSAVTLRKTTGVDASQIRVKNYDEWKKSVAAQLKYSGPKW